MKRTALFQIVIGLFLITSCESNEPNAQVVNNQDSFEKNEPSKPYVKISLSGAEQELVGNLTDFSFDALHKVALGNNGNIIISPLSISSVLSMLANGASGQTLEEYKSFFNIEDLNYLNILNKKLIERLCDLDNNVRFNSANAVFYENASINDDFKKTLEVYYNTKFYNDGQKQLNKWCNDNTWGMIKEFELSNSPVAVFNATAFMGRWADSFTTKNTTYGKLFTANDGTKKECYMMNKKAAGLYYEGDRYKAAGKEYGNGAFEFTIVLPDENVSVDNFLGTFDINEFNSYLENRIYVTDLDLSMPRFKVENDILLNSIFSSLGFFTQTVTNGDYSNMTDCKGNMSLKQKSVIEVSEEGTKAAAVTGGYITTDNTPHSYARLNANRPFVFLIHEQSTKAILFMGVVRTL